MSFFRRLLRRKARPAQSDFGADELRLYEGVFGSSPPARPSPGMVSVICVMPSADADQLEKLFEDKRIFVRVLEMPVLALANPSIRRVIERYRDRIGRLFDAVPHSYDFFCRETASDYDLTAGDIRAYSQGQLKVSRGLARHFLDLSESDYRYLRALRYWLGVFAEGPVSFVFSDRVEHGDIGDSLLYEVAGRQGVPVYHLSLEFSTGRVMAYALKTIGPSGYELCDARAVLGAATVADMSAFLHSSSCAKPADRIVGRLDEASILESGRRIERACRRFENARRGLSARDLFDADTKVFPTWITRDPRNVLRDWRDLLEVKRAYEAISEAPVAGERYVFYALHLEPEAAILNRGRLSSQLFAIQLLADCLPAGWKLYVKEHPMQFQLTDFSKEGFFHLSNNISYFRSKRFYDNIRRLPNVRLIHVDVPSEPLISGARAVATISGTICLEAVAARKPLFVFSEDTNVISAVNGVFRINSANDVKRAMDRLAAGYEPPYDDVDEIISRSIVGMIDGASPIAAAERCRLLENVFRYLVAQRG